MTKQALHLYDNDTVKWEHNRTLYCLHVQTDPDPMNPRRDWDNPETLMACWHRHYDLGDEIEDKNANEFWQRLVRENVTGREIFEAAKSGKLPGIRLAQNSENAGFVDIYETSYLRTIFGDTDPKECLEYEGVSVDAVAECLMDDLTITHCMTLMEPYAEWMPLWLYDHSGITMSCGSRTYPYNDQWDSGQVGWIVAMKETIVREFFQKNPEDADWRKKAIELMELDVAVYDQYLTNDVYGFTLYEGSTPGEDDEDPEWTENDSCWGFFGSDVLENGIVDHVGNGLREAIEAGTVECGEATRHQVTYYTF